ncbi:SPOR domain-containing protein [Polaribacter sp. NJDZ03]|uniref:SPOR domain-containing protein n=1 Tax=Polaribacter sp. NJDZ03 TaxID=2855841 RepID=UPI001C49CB4F|nr:SPOR domain-containing protein [Polaribacter sp. NJDZ03]
MKSKLTVLSFLFVLLTTSYNSFSQNKTNESAEIKNIVSKKRSFNSTYGFGYRIQLYNGNEQKARQFMARFKVEFPGIFSKLVYYAPEWKVQVGNYKTKLEADKDLIKFQDKFSGIIVIPMGK